MDTTTIPPTSIEPSTSIGPYGTAPGISFVEQQKKPLSDSSDARAAALPLLGAGVFLLAVIAMVVVRARRTARARAAAQR